MATETDYTRKCQQLGQQLDVLIDLLERENRRLKAEKRGWIPVAEHTLPEAENMYRLPTKRYLCQRENGGVRQFFVGARLCDPKGYLKDWWDWYGTKIRDSEVVAYMPLPEPYKEETE